MKGREKLKWLVTLSLNTLSLCLHKKKKKFRINELGGKKEREMWE